MIQIVIYARGVAILTLSLVVNFVHISTELWTQFELHTLWVHHMVTEVASFDPDSFFMGSPQKECL